MKMPFCISLGEHSVTLSISRTENFSLWLGFMMPEDIGKALGLVQFGISLLNS